MLLQATIDTMTNLYNKHIFYNRNSAAHHNTVPRIIMFLLLALLYNSTTSAQGNAAKRYEIDAKRAGVSPQDKDALPRSREFIRLDSTYYVGYMYEGLYKADRSSDMMGYKNAIPSIKKSLHLFEDDFGSDLKTLFLSPQLYMQYVNRYADFLQIANTLRECYDHLEMADSVMWVLNKVDSYNFPKEHLFTTTTKAWTYHRNRFYTSDKFAFLHNNVAANEKEAFTLCYKALSNIQQHRSTNDVWFGPGQSEGDRLNVYHYLALLHCYNKNYDSSEYYYQKMIEGGSISWNNYANLKHEIGNFSVASELFDRDRYKYAEKTLKEPYYYLPMLDVYAGRTKQAISTAKEAIDMAGSTPGFGWYNIALGRGYLYDGQLDSAEYVLNKAANFKEIHIGTTLTQSQYDFSINLLKLQLIEKKIGLQKFVKKGWWYSPTSLFKIASLKLQKVLLQYVLVNQLSANPERDRVVYDLFCSESTTTYDEAMYLLHDFSPSFFIKKFEKLQAADTRKSVHRYFDLLQNKMKWEDGDEGEAYDGYRQIVKQVVLDTANEKLFMGRLYEGLCRGSKSAGLRKDFDYYTNVYYEEYPQLMPFTNLKVKMKLVTSGETNAASAKVIEDLKKCNIDFVETGDANTPVATLSFTERSGKYQISINTLSGSGKPVVNEQLVFTKPEGVGIELALRLFGKGGTLVFN